MGMVRSGIAPCPMIRFESGTAPNLITFKTRVKNAHSALMDSREYQCNYRVIKNRHRAFWRFLFGSENWRL
jgi:hypothetical protein